MSGHPMQPIVNGRFKPNAVVRYLLDNNGGTHIDMNALAVLDFSQEDREQFAQLIGYSLSGFGELGYVSDETYATASAMSEADISEQDARISYLEKVLGDVRAGLRAIVPSVFKIHPDDLEA